MKKDIDFIARLEKAIKEKYGEEAIENPKKHWNQDKEIKHDEQRKEFYKRSYFNKAKNIKENYKGFLVNKKLLNKEEKLICPVCQSFSLNVDDDLYMMKYECCFKCYIEYVEGREERWKTGWRPSEEQINGNNTRNN